MNLRQDIGGEFFADWQRRAAHSKVGKIRPDQAAVIRKIHAEGKLKKTDLQKIAIGIRTKEWIAKNGHPRGALGMKHSAKTRQIVSESTRERMKNLTDDERAMYAKRASILGRKTSSNNRAKTSWKAGWREFGGVRKYYRSRWEANYARYLEWLKSKGEIIGWEHEPETFWFDGIKRGCMSYLPDFRVTEKSGAIVYHEVKGWMDARSKTTIRRMAKYHPEIRLIVIEAKAYKSITKTMQHIIAGWE